MSQIKPSDLRSIAGKLSVDGVFPEANLVSYGDTVIVKPGATTSTGRVFSGEEVNELLEGGGYSSFPMSVEYGPSLEAMLEYMGGDETESQLDALEDLLSDDGSYGGASARKTARIRKRYGKVLSRFKHCRELLAAGKGSGIRWRKEKRLKSRVKKCDRKLKRLVKIWSKMKKKGVDRSGLMSPYRYVRYKVTKPGQTKYVVPAAHRTSSTSTSSASKPRVVYKTKTVYRDRPVYQDPWEQSRQPRQQEQYYAEPGYPDPYYQQSQLPSRIALPAYPNQPQYTATASADARRLQQQAYHMDQRALEGQVANMWSGLPGEYGSSQDELIADLRGETVGFLNGNIEHDYYGDADDDLELVFGEDVDAWDIELSDDDILEMDEDDDIMGGAPRRKHRHKQRRITRKPSRAQLGAIASSHHDEGEDGDDFGADVDSLLDDIDEDIEAEERELAASGDPSPRTEELEDEAPESTSHLDSESEEGQDENAKVRAKVYQAVEIAMKEDPDSTRGPKWSNLARKLSSLARTATKIDKMFMNQSSGQKDSGMSGVDYGRLKPKSGGKKGPAILVIAIRKRKTPVDSVKGDVVSYGAAVGYTPPGDPMLLDVFASDLHQVEHFYSPEHALSQIADHTQVSDFEGDYGVSKVAMTKMVRSNRKLSDSEYAIVARNIRRLSPQNLRYLANSRGSRHGNLVQAARMEMKRRRGMRRHSRRLTPAPRPSRRFTRVPRPPNVQQAAPAPPAPPADPCAPPNTHFINASGYQEACPNFSGEDDFSFGAEFPYGNAAPFPAPRRVGPEVF